MLLHYLCSSLLLLFRFTHGEIGSVGSACGILSGPSSHSILSSVFTPCSFHNPDVRLSTSSPLVCPYTFTSHPSHSPSRIFIMLSPIPLPHGGREERGKKKNIIITSPIQSYSIFVHCLTQSPHLSPFTFHPRHRPPRIVSTCLSDCPRAGLLLPPPCATPGIASLPLPGWASPWSPTALSMMSLLRQAKIY